MSEPVLAYDNFQKSDGELTSSPAPENFKFESEDWSLFRTVEGLQQKAGVAKHKLSRLVLKELTDNGLDTGAAVNVGELPNGGGYFVEDDGPGIDGAPEQVARLFSINRPMVSTKLLRLPTRGALGSGLRVVAGAVLASGGSLIVITRGKRSELRPERDGSTTVVGVKDVKFPVGTRVEISFGQALPKDTHALSWAQLACQLAGTGEIYAGKSSPHWYDAPQFLELLSASGARPVRELIASLDGCTGARAGEIVAEVGLGRVLCKDIDGRQAERLLAAARENARPVKPLRLGAIGPIFPDTSYGCSQDVVALGSIAPQAMVPFVAEAWARKAKHMGLIVSVNRKPITGAVEAAHNKRDIYAFGCGLSRIIAQAPKDAEFAIWINVTTPYMPITSDGKAPDLLPFYRGICEAVGKAVKKVHCPTSGDRTSQKDVVLDNLDAAIAKVSDGGRYRFNQRQLLYVLRPIVREELVVFA